MEKLTEKQKRFIDYYIETGNATESAIKSGYSEKTAGVIGNENLNKPYIRKAIDERIKSKQDDRIASAEEVLRILTQGARQQLTEDVVVVESVGDYQSEARVIQKGTSIKDAARCAELLAKRYGLLTDKIDLSGDLTLEVVMDYGEEDNSQE